uniref:GCR079 n=1 Tax=Schmidtea mediterranea TaxID=79327 RepID=A0A193KUK6_SCHMD|nr:GCR079 [Schmidtea mediterranea]
MESEINRTENLQNNLTLFLIRKYLWSSTFYLHRYGSLLWLMSGLVLNTLAFIIWTRPRLRRSNTSANYLAGIAMSDTIFWLLYILHYMQTSWDICVQDIPVWCEMFQGLFISSQYFSVPLVLIFSLERYIAVCHPFKREKLCTHRKALVNTIVCGVTALILGCSQSISREYNDVSKKCDIRGSVVNTRNWFIFATGTEILISALLPFATLIVNILVIIELKSITSKTTLIKPSVTAPLTSSTSTSEQHLQIQRNQGSTEKLNIKKHSISQQNKEKSAFKSSTILLLSVSFLLIVTTLPTGFVYALQFVCPVGNETLSVEQMKVDPDWIKFINYQILKEVVDFFSMIHFSINFVIYYITGESFRTEFYLLFQNAKRFKGPDDTSIGNSYFSNRNGHNQRVNHTEMLRKQAEHTTITNI